MSWSATVSSQKLPGSSPTLGVTRPDPPDFPWTGLLVDV